MTTNPVLVEVVRGALVESRHHGAFAVVNSQGDVLHVAGDIDRYLYARSAIKPLQAIPFIESGAPVRFSLSDSELALSCASHNGEPRHVELAKAWLGKIGLSPDDLECGSHLPYHAASTEQLLRDGVTVDATYNNCSGKHCAMLSTARCLDEPTGGYIDIDHPVQKRVRQVLSEMSDTDLSHAPIGIDGCGIPVTGLSLRQTAYAMARFVAYEALAPERADACRNIYNAVTAEPFLVAGTHRFCTEVMAECGKTVLIKTGAEGFFAGAIPDLKIGIALKIDDGAKRASEVVMAKVLADCLRSVDGSLADKVRQRQCTALNNVAGNTVGQIRAI